MMTAHWVDGGAAGGAGGATTGTAGLARSRITVRTSCRAAPSGSRAVITMAFAPSRRVRGALTAIVFCGLRSSC